MLLFFVAAVHSWEHHIKPQKQEGTEFVLAPAVIVLWIVSAISSARAEVNRSRRRIKYYYALLSQKYHAAGVNHIVFRLKHIRIRITE